MKVKNIAFSGFMASILMAGAAYAVDAPTLATDKYVQDGVNYAIDQAQGYTDTELDKVLESDSYVAKEATKATQDGNGDVIADTYLKSATAATTYETKGTAAGLVGTLPENKATVVAYIEGESAAAEAAIDNLDGRLDTLEATVGNATSGLVADVAANTQSITNLGNSKADKTSVYTKGEVDSAIANATGADSNLSKDVASLKTTVGNSTSGLVKDVADNTAAISGINNSAVMGSGITAALREGYDSHVANNDIHVTTDDKATWNAKQAALSDAQITATNSGITAALREGYDSHVGNTGIHVTADQKTAWTNKQDAISDLSTIRTNATAGKSASDTIATYGNIVTHNSAEFATAEQGALAESAIQLANLKCEAGKYCLLSDQGALTPYGLAISNPQWTGSSTK